MKVAITSFTEREMELGIENNALRKTLEAARAGWKAEVKRLKDGRRERIASRVLAALVNARAAQWDRLPVQRAEWEVVVTAFSDLAIQAADAQIAALDATVPPLSVHTDRVR